MKIKYVSLCLGLIEIGFGNVFAASQSQSLSESVGATDVYKLNCDSLAGQSTAYASLQIKDDTIGQSASAPQLININLS